MKRQELSGYLYRTADDVGTVEEVVALFSLISEWVKELIPGVSWRFLIEGFQVRLHIYADGTYHWWIES